MNLRRLALVIGLTMVLSLTVGAARAKAADEVVTDCTTDTQLRTKLAAMQSSGGGTLTFACARQNPRIEVGLLKLPDIGTPTVIDGDGVVQISGGGAWPLFRVMTTGSLTLKGITLSDAYSPGEGAAVKNEGFLTVEGSTFVGNHSLDTGGAIYSSGSLTVTDSIFEANTAFDAGAIAIVKYPGKSVLIRDSTFHSNTATGPSPFFGFSGAITVLSGSVVRIESSHFTDNTWTNGGSLSAAAAIGVGDDATLILSTSEITDIRTGLLAVVAGALNLERSSIAAPAAQVMVLDGTLRLRNSTAIVRQLHAEGSGGIVLSYSTVLGDQLSILYGNDNSFFEFKNSIIQAPAANACALPVDSVLSSGYNLASDDTCQLTEPTDRPNTLASFVAFANWGGPTRTLLLQPGSAGIDQGTCASEAPTDQRGFARPQGNLCDIGATELRKFPISVQVAGSGKVTSSPPLINCSPTCSAQAYEYKAVSLLAIASAGFHFDHWSGACSGAGTCILPMSGPASVVAQFVSDSTQTPKQYLPLVRR